MPVRKRDSQKTDMDKQEAEKKSLSELRESAKKIEDNQREFESQQEATKKLIEKKRRNIQKGQSIAGHGHDIGTEIIRMFESCGVIRRQTIAEFQEGRKLHELKVETDRTISKCETFEQKYDNIRNMEKTLSNENLSLMQEHMLQRNVAKLKQDLKEQYGFDYDKMKKFDRDTRKTVTDIKEKMRDIYKKAKGEYEKGQPEPERKTEHFSREPEHNKEHHHDREEERGR